MTRPPRLSSRDLLPTRALGLGLLLGLGDVAWAGEPALPAPVTPAPQAGDLYVTSAPAGADILLDGAPSGQRTPAMLRGIPAGAHLVQARTDCARAEKRLEVQSGVITRAELSLVTGPGALDLSGSPAGAVVLVDGVEVGALPLRLESLPCGDHQVTARAPGFLEATKTVRVLAFEQGAAQIDLAREQLGTLVVDITPLDAQVALDGLSLGVGPRTLERVPAGRHTVTGSLEGYAQQGQDVTVVPDEIVRVNLALTLAPPEPVRPEGAGSPPWGRVALNLGVSGVTLGAGALGLLRYRDAVDAYEIYLLTSDSERSQQIYEEQVAPARQRALVWGGVAAVGMIGSTVLWVRTDF